MYMFNVFKNIAYGRIRVLRDNLTLNKIIMVMKEINDTDLQDVDFYIQDVFSSIDTVLKLDNLEIMLKQRKDSNVSNILITLVNNQTRICVYKSDYYSFKKDNASNYLLLKEHDYYRRYGVASVWDKNIAIDWKYTGEWCNYVSSKISELEFKILLKREDAEKKRLKEMQEAEEKLMNDILVLTLGNLIHQILDGMRR